jgi:uncharacterized membrane protein
MANDIAKTLSFAVLHFSVGFGITYLLTGSVAIATGVALLEPLANTVVFFFPERSSNRRSSLSIPAERAIFKNGVRKGVA